MLRIAVCLFLMWALGSCTGSPLHDTDVGNLGSASIDSNRTDGALGSIPQLPSVPKDFPSGSIQSAGRVHTGPASAALVQARQHQWDPQVNAVSFRSLDAFFETRSVRAGQTRALPYNIRALTPEVDFGDEKLSFQEALIRTYTNAILVLQDGEIVFEQYLNAGNASDRYVGWSISKSLTSVLFGMARDRGFFTDLKEPIESVLPELVGTPFEGATFEDLLRMRAGTSYRERRAEGLSDLALLSNQSTITNRMNFTNFSTLELQRESPPGTRFNYSTLTTGILAQAIERKTGHSLPVLTEHWLWKPAGMEHDAYWIMDLDGPNGVALAGGGFNASVRDFGRLGLLMLNGGVASRRLLSREWVEQSTAQIGDEPAIPNTDRRYGYHWWRSEGSAVFEAIGIYGQFISIDPKTRSVIVKMSHWPAAGGRSLMQESRLLLSAIRDSLSVD